ncbi:hypothetical protein RSAG8_13288, partial [Rhizoctonia solani AG-8 WAC10335]
MKSLFGSEELDPSGRYFLLELIRRFAAYPAEHQTSDRPRYFSLSLFSLYIVMRVLDSDMNEHAQKRANLIATERSLRFDAEVITKATENERRAVEIVNNLRMREAKEIWQASKGRLM